MRPSAWQRRRVPAGEEEPESPLDGPDDRAASKARLHRLQVALERLSPPHRVALTLWALEGLEPAVIAQMTGASLSATRSRTRCATPSPTSRARASAKAEGAMCGPPSTSSRTMT